jgi:hypothetical protein
MDRFLTVTEATQSTGRSEKTICWWIKRLQETDPVGYGQNVQVVYPNVQVVYPNVQGEYRIREPFLIKMLGQGVQEGGVDDVQDEGMDNVQGSIAGGSGILDYLKQEIKIQRESGREKESLIRQLIDTQARERERIDTLLTRMRQDIADLSARLVLQAPKEESNPVLIQEPVQTQISEPESWSEPVNPEAGTFTFSDFMWLFGQSLKRFLGKKIW